MRSPRALLPIIVLLVAACSGSGTELEERPVGDILAEAGDQFDALDSVRFTIDVAGEPVYLDADETLAATRADGQYAAPDAFQAVVDVTAFDLSTEVGAISIGETRWVTNPVTGTWSELAAGAGFDPRELFDNEVGVAATLRGMPDAELAGRSGDYTVTGTVGGGRVRTLTAGLLDAEAVALEVTIDGGSMQITTLRFPIEGSEWTITFSEFDEPVTIEPPDTG